MTDEEKAEEYINKNPRAKILYCFEADRIKQIKKALLYGLEEGRKENILKECANDCKIPEGCDVFVRYEIVEERNAELKKIAENQQKISTERFFEIKKLNEQIEKMKCCANCKHDNDSNTDYYCEDCKRFAGETNLDKWELQYDR